MTLGLDAAIVLDDREFLRRGGRGVGIARTAAGAANESVEGHDGRDSEEKEVDHVVVETRDNGREAGKERREAGEHTRKDVEDVTLERPRTEAEERKDESKHLENAFSMLEGGDGLVDYAI